MLPRQPFSTHSLPAMSPLLFQLHYRHFFCVQASSDSKIVFFVTQFHDSTTNYPMSYYTVGEFYCGPGGLGLGAKRATIKASDGTALSFKHLFVNFFKILSDFRQHGEHQNCVSMPFLSVKLVNYEKTNSN